MAGSHAITARFQEAPGSPVVASPVLGQQGHLAVTTTVLTSTANPSMVGQTVTVPATVKALAPGTGAAARMLDLYDDGVLVAAKAQTSGVASFALKPTLGTHTFTATYAGSANYLSSTTTASLVPRDERRRGATQLNQAQPHRQIERPPGVTG